MLCAFVSVDYGIYVGVLSHSIVCQYVTFTENSDEDEYYVFTPSKPHKAEDDDDDECDEYLKIVVDQEEISAFKQDHNSLEQ